MLKRGLSTRKIAREVGLSFVTISRIAKEVGIKLEAPRRLTSSVRERIVAKIDEGFSTREIARLCGVAPITVSAYARKGLNEAGSIQFHRPRSARRCPRHGAVTVWPCVACSAEAARG